MPTNKVDGVAFITYETPLTPCGGIAAVMKYLPDAVRRASELRTVVLSPFHHQMPKLQGLAPFEDLQSLGQVGVNAAPPVQMHLWRCGQGARPDPCEWIYCLPDEPDIFAGRRHPYDVPSPPEGRGLVDDALIFGAAVPKILHVLAPGRRWAVVMQDWEGATAALALASRRHRHALFLVMHNSYDSGSLSDERLRRAGIDPTHCPGKGASGTILTRALRLVQRPLLTVSQGFARDLSEDPFQRDVMTPHLQPLFHPSHGPSSVGIMGIDNGPFAAPSIPQDVLEKSRRLSARSKTGIRPLRTWKRSRREAFCLALRGLISSPGPTDTRPLFSRVWGDIGSFLKRNEDDHEMTQPWFVMGGRDDARQKGYDIAAQAARGALDAGAEGCFLWFPIPGEEGLGGLQFLSELALDFPEQVLVFPFLFREGYMAALQGATYALMPSFYEPFGAANEFYLQGTVGIGRATGGLVQQIIPLKEVDGTPWAGYTDAVSRRTVDWHAPDAQPTGILFREADDIPTTLRDWQGINDAQYQRQSDKTDRVEQRKQFPTWLAMVAALQETLEEATDLYREHPLTYDRMLLDGNAFIEARFSWEQTAALYLKIIAPHIIVGRGE